MPIPGVEKATSLSPDGATYNIRALLGGPSGSGKSWGAITAPGPTLLIDLDGRKESLAGLSSLDVLPIVETNPIPPKAFDKVKHTLTTLAKEGGSGYRTIILDGLTQLGVFAMNYSLLLDPKKGLGGTPAKHHYAPQMKGIMDCLQLLLALPCHTICTCHLQITGDTEKGEEERVAPLTTGKLSASIPSLFSETYYCFRKPGPGGITQYFWQTSGSLREECFKSGLNTLGQYWPSVVPIIWEDGRVTEGGFTNLLLKRFPSLTSTLTPPSLEAVKVAANPVA